MRSITLTFTVSGETELRQTPAPLLLLGAIEAPELIVSEAHDYSDEALTQLLREANREGAQCDDKAEAQDDAHCEKQCRFVAVPGIHGPEEALKREIIDHWEKCQPSIQYPIGFTPETAIDDSQALRHQPAPARHPKAPSRFLTSLSITRAVSAKKTENG